MIAARSHRASTSGSTCDDRKVVRPSAPPRVEHRHEPVLDERVEALGRLVEHGQFGVVLERLHDRELLAHALRVAAHGAVEVGAGEPQRVAQLGRVAPAASRSRPLK